MPRFRLMTPDAQYPDDGVIERASPAPMSTGISARAHARRRSGIAGGCDAIVVWHEMKIDRDFWPRSERCHIIVRAGVGFDHIDLSAATESPAFRSAIRPTTAPAKSPITPSG